MEVLSRLDHALSIFRVLTAELPYKDLEEKKFIQAMNRRSGRLIFGASGCITFTDISRYVIRYLNCPKTEVGGGT